MKNMNKYQIAKILSVLATVLTIGGLVISNDLVMLPGFLMTIVAYCLCGFGKAVLTPFSWAKWGFLTGPFPMNLAEVALFFVFGCFFVFFVPAVPVFRAAKEKGF